jgi:hypothetical protein
LQSGTPTRVSKANDKTNAVGKEKPMFTVKLQSQDRKGNYSTLKTINIPSFSQPVAEKAIAVAKEKDLRVSMYLRDEPVPEGWASRELEYSTQIWLQVELSAEEALAELDALPF